jgi:hypothetical protein
MGGEVCLPERKVCISVPPLALERELTLRIAPTDDAPGGLIGDAWDITPTGTAFSKPATISFRYDGLAIPANLNVNLLRIYTRQAPDGGSAEEWVPTDSPRVNALRAELEGDVRHLSPFFVLRADRLPDGGLPIEGDGGPVIPPPPPPPPPFDAGRPDAGRPDAGRPDSGVMDAGQPDAGPKDAGPTDSGVMDAGQPDAGPPDAGPPDAGPPDAGPPDAGPPDAGVTPMLAIPMLETRTPASTAHLGLTRFGGHLSKHVGVFHGRAKAAEDEAEIHG